MVPAHDTSVPYVVETLPEGIQLPDGWESTKDDAGNVVGVSGPCPSCFGVTFAPPNNKSGETIAPDVVTDWFTVVCNCGTDHAEKSGSCGRTWLVKVRS
jgi:hypothetical protein